MGKVKFYQVITLSGYEALENKDPDALYFILEDANKRIYLGDRLYSFGVNANWAVTDPEDPAFIYNKPVTITTQQAEQITLNTQHRGEIPSDDPHGLTTYIDEGLELKANKIQNPTDEQKLQFLRMSSSGEFDGSNFYEVSSDDELRLALGDPAYGFKYIQITGSIQSTASTYTIAGWNFITRHGNLLINQDFVMDSYSALTAYLGVDVRLYVSNNRTIRSISDTTMFFYAYHVPGNNIDLTIDKAGTGNFTFSYGLKTGTTLISSGGAVIEQNERIFPIAEFVPLQQTILECNALDSKYSFISCKETNQIYYYEASGASYTIDNDRVLATDDGGDTRWISITYKQSGLIDRGDVSAYDFTLASFITDGVWRDLDLSSIVPVGTTRIKFKLYYQGTLDAPGGRFALRKKGNVNEINTSIIQWWGPYQDNGTYYELNSFCDSNRVVQYKTSLGAGGTYASLDLVVLSYE